MTDLKFVFIFFNKLLQEISLIQDRYAVRRISGKGSIIALLTSA